MSTFNDGTSNQDKASPITNLANSFRTKLTVRRKLTMSESSVMPKKCQVNEHHGNFK